MEISNRQIARIFRLGAQLLELHGENPFKIRSYETAAFRIRQIPEQVAGMSEEELEGIDGIGKNLSQKILEIGKTGSYPELDKLLGETPVGLLELVNIKGIGAKKVRTLWQELGVNNAEEVLKACESGQVENLKGFGKKTQDNLEETLHFYFETRGQYMYAEALSEAEPLLKYLEANPSVAKVCLTGEMRRKCNTISQIDILLDVKEDFDEDKVIKASGYASRVDGILKTDEFSIKVVLHYATEKDWVEKLMLTTGNTEHLAQLDEGSLKKAKSEEEAYALNKKPYIIPEMREGREEFEIMAKRKQEDIISYGDLRGCLHNHSTYSDGSNTLEQMAEACRKRGLEYFGISDHSQTAAYAGGLKPKAVLKQMKEVDGLNTTMAPFRIFKGIESDILGDGSLDYEEDILKQFDFVVASVHSNLKMKEEEATARLIKAIENPYTTILGHMTGRLLLMRPGYEVDHKKVIDACAANKVAIEINANPRRLDIDWTWANYAVEKGVMLSINPDAHEEAGIDDMYFGVCTARKAGVPKEAILNTFSLKDIEAYFNAKKP